MSTILPIRLSLPWLERKFVLVILLLVIKHFPLIADDTHPYNCAKL
jgi:hypothetical protein